MSVSTTPNGRFLTEHAQQSLLRHGFQQPFDLVDNIIENYSRRTTQDDGATVYIQRVGGRTKRYNIVIEGTEGIVTGLLNLTPRELENLGRNYGFNANL
jgi:ABC-type sulfate transport system substrate-binding protein